MTRLHSFFLLVIIGIGAAQIAGCTEPTDSKTKKSANDSKADWSNPEAEVFDTDVWVDKKDGKVVTLESGLQYQIVKEGTGPEAKAGDTVKVNYTGWLTNGKKFDSSLKMGGRPLSVRLGYDSVIKGWHLGINGMKVGEKRKLRIPPDLGYGDQGKGPVPPNAVLIFDVEVLSMNPK